MHLVGEHLLVFKPTKKERKNGKEGKLSVNRVRMPELFAAFFYLFFLASVKSGLRVGSTEGDGSLMDRTSFPQGPCFFFQKNTSSKKAPVLTALLTKSFSSHIIDCLCHLIMTVPTHCRQAVVSSECVCVVCVKHHSLLLAYFQYVDKANRQLTPRHYPWFTSTCRRALKEAFLTVWIEIHTFLLLPFPSRRR